MPLLVYVSREKRPFRPHHFKAGAVNVLVSAQSLQHIKLLPLFIGIRLRQYCSDRTSGMTWQNDKACIPDSVFLLYLLSIDFLCLVSMALRFGL
ncbi:hypothetical protein JRO89_XS03G0108300 [Xanthoceras sorbifolium]|uniref:Uncharacterized protein n=1 Tax=Xanthoceras sorbifolium TaxID=99658 RepID=A0ABQ8I9H3_9ROSI|nr:hypothetical protein JRO89_XS03G0108300 [Xanthoceras sorbifolium]